MPIPWEWQHKIDALVKPHGGRRWSETAKEAARQALAGRDNPVVLEAGCGTEGWIARMLREEGARMHVVGFDINPACLHNKDVDEVSVASIYEIPRESESVDLALSGYVLEHLEDPARALRELYRVLKPGGSLVFWTPNRLNPVMMLSAVTGMWFHVMLRKLVWGPEGADNAPTYYRSNTIGKIKRLAAQTGFECAYAGTFSSAYQYFRMCKPTYLAACILNKPAALWPLNLFRLTILGVLRRPLNDHRGVL